MLLLFSSFYIFTESAIGSYQDSNPPGIHVYSDWQGPMNERRIQRETWIKGIRHTCACEFVSRGTQKMTPLLYAMHSSVPGVIIQYWIIRRKFVGFNENGKTHLFSCDTIDRLQLMIDSFFSVLGSIFVYRYSFTQRTRLVHINNFDTKSLGREPQITVLVSNSLSLFLWHTVIQNCQG